MKRGSIIIALSLLSSLGFSQSKLQYYLNQADSLSQAYEHAQASYYYDSVADIAVATDNTEAYIEALLGKGIANRYDHKNKNFDQAYEYFYQTFKLLQSSPQPNPMQVAQVYYHLATTERVRMNYKKAMEYGSIALNMAAELNNPWFQVRTHNMMGNILNNLEELEPAIKHYQQAIALEKTLKIKKDIVPWLYYENLGITYMESSQYQEALRSLQQALKRLELDRPDSAMKARIQWGIGKALFKLEDKEKARTHYQSSLRIQTKDHYKMQNGIAFGYWELGEMYSDYDHQDSALYFLHKSIDTIEMAFDKKSLIRTPSLQVDSLNDMEANYDIIKVLDLMGVSLWELYQKNHDIRYLVSAKNIYEVADQLMVKNRSTLDEEDPTLHLADHFKEVYGNALRTLMELYNQTADLRILSTAYQYIERNKQTLLLKNKILSHRTGYDKSQQRRVQQIQLSINDLRHQVLRAESSNNPTIETIDQLIKQLINLHAERKEVVKTEMRDTLEYQIHSLVEVQKSLRENTLMLNYLWTDQDIYAMAISSEQVMFKRLKNTTDHEIESYSKLLHKIQLKGFEKQFNEFTNSAHSLYANLMAPFLESNAFKNTREIIMIPDGPLSMVPVAALISETPPEPTPNYRDLHYLIKEYTISYAFSASLLVSEPAPVMPDRRLLGFSSSWLPGTQSELDRITALWDTDQRVLHGKLATEQNFKELAPEYDIIHLASHALAGNSRYEGRFIFNTDPTSLEDDTLYTYEVYPLNLKARLTVLSACETGLGHHHEGEGVFSLARGFAYSGCPTVVMSLWKVGDKQTQQLMTYFYQQLMDGQSVAQAMRNAQLSYLEMGNEISAHPAHWASFEVIGNGFQRFNTPKPYWQIILLAALIVGIVMLMVSKLSKP